jgi:hypothetical protein
MSVAITCPGCGQVLQVGAGDPRPEIECLWCGAQVPVHRKTAPAAAETQPARPAAPPPEMRRPSPPSSAAPRPHREGEAGAAPLVPSVPPFLTLEAAPPPKPARWADQTPYQLKDAPGVPIPLPEPLPAPAVSPAPSATPSASDDEDGLPYELAGGDDRPCPNCGRYLAVDATLCPTCGFNQKTGTRVAKVYEPIERRWEAGWPFAKRRQWFITGQAVWVPMGLLGAYLLGSFWAFLGPWLGFTLLTGFLLGTYDRVNLTRSKRGVVRLAHSWRVFFRERPAEVYRISEFEGVVTGKARSADFWDWVMLILLFMAGVVPGVLWFYYAILKDSFFVALAKDHGHPSVRLYQGWDEGHMREIARTVCTAAEWPCPV